MKLDISPDTRALVAVQILAVMLERGFTHDHAIAKTVRLTEDLIEGLERSPHGSFPDQQEVR